MSVASLLNPAHLKHFKDIAVLLAKYGRPDLLPHDGEDAGDGKAADLPADLQALGPTFVKLGQLLSTRSDLLPLEYIEALGSLQDDAEPFLFEEVEQIVQDELGVRLSKAFATFDQTPVGCASLGQVHRATMRDGRDVAVKVQRPGIRSRIIADLDALDSIADLLDEHTDVGRRYRFGELVTQFRQSLLDELDYTREARNLRSIGARLREFSRITCPDVIADYSGSRVLTMTFLPGRKVTDLNPLAEIDLDADAVAGQLFEAYLKQILVDGLFHADPHPGNMLITGEGKLAVIDFGMVGRIQASLQEHLLQLLSAIADGKGDMAADLAIKIGGRQDDLFDGARFRRDIARIIGDQQGASVGEMKVGEVVMLVTQACAAGGVRVPAEISLLGKTLLNLDGIGRALAPDFDPNRAIRHHAAEIAQHRMLKSLAPSELFQNIFDVKELLTKTPARLNEVLAALAEGKLKLDVDAVDEASLINAFHKIANRITVGLVLAGLIVGAALMMNIETSWTLFGYPGLAITFFLLAAAGALVLVWRVLFGDDR